MLEYTIIGILWAFALFSLYCVVGQIDGDWCDGR
jgi:hypothetical protein